MAVDRQLFVVLCAAAIGCGGGSEPDPEPDASTPTGPQVDEFLDVGCSTSVVLGLSLEIADELACTNPSALDAFSPSASIEFSSSAVLPYLAPQAIVDLEDAVAASVGSVGEPLRINSSFRTVVQQYLLYEWFLRGRCGITAAATPGRSNHESGRAIDVSNNVAWASSLAAFGWDQNVPGDAVHFEHLASPDNRGLDVLAFQTLWNRMVPDDPIAADGVFGPETQERLRAAPADGFGAEACESALSPKRAALLGVVGREQQAKSSSCGI